MVNQKRRRLLRHPLVVLTAALGLLTLAETGVAGAQGGGGTSKPPAGAVSPWVIPTLGNPPLSAANAAALHGFDDTGLIQSATVDAGCGGTVTLNGQTIVIPCNLIVQMPANTLTWAEFNNGPVNGLELHVIGNMVAGGRHIAGLAFASQQSLNSGNGVITGLDYANGTLLVDDAKGGAVRVQLNDPVIAGLGTGRFSAGQSPDARFSVDQDNPTVHAATGYPMCIPRTDPAGAADPLCPQSNRPLALPSGCRNFSIAGVVPPKSGELGAPAVGQVYCTQFVMPDPALTTVGGDARQQAPFEVGDYVSYSGTLFGSGPGAYVSAHTVEANVGIYTQPGKQPAYTAIGAFGVGTADPLATAVNGAAQETQDRIFLEAETTDVKTPVDIYYVDKDATLGNRSRWVTPFEMTGENQLGAPSGGITTQNTGPQPQRARLRATKAPAGLLSQPSRNVRVAQRSLCTPTPLSATGTTIDQGALDKCFNDNATLRTVANGLAAGQYQAPTFEYIFPENVKPGDVLVPADMWHLPFLRNGEVGGVGPLSPTPW